VSTEVRRLAVGNDREDGECLIGIEHDLVRRGLGQEAEHAVRPRAHHGPCPAYDVAEVTRVGTSERAAHE
jgi:hypothetical protein